jgi:hypothetical protein
MPKYLNLQINEPCHEDWNRMTPNEQGKFCGSCNKAVVDFTNMTDGQLVDFFKLNTGNTCGRFYEDQINKPMAIPRKEIPWLKYFLTITIPAFLFSAKGIAQKKAVVEKVEKSTVKNKPDTLKKSDFGFWGGGYTIYDSTEIPDKKHVMLSYWNHPTKASEPIKEETLPEVKVYDILKSSKCRSYISGAVSVVATKLICTTSGINIKGVSPEPIKDDNQFNVYPNPVPTNSILNLSFSKDIVGKIMLQIFTANGDLLKQEYKTFGYKTKTTFINTNNLPFGFYICVATNIVTNEKLSKEFLVK